eukprot:TRINITY_DN50322_c0_g1_i1.p1 TRINITY_DN50322_c0_g1~~TRINITY_DN50322_c0_g1_i1.p1  ORF type:complete len:223 (-),score=27.52 TRINITY_DN50322_c0_g1_i1:23-691(-)
MIRPPPRSTLSSSSAASDVYKRQVSTQSTGAKLSRGMQTPPALPQDVKLEEGRHEKFERYPHSLVWTPIPFISWCCPCIGHLGICDSNGVIFDFAGPYRIGKHQLAFGDATRVIQLDPSKVMELGGAETHSEAWDRALQHGNEIYKQRMHNLCCDNCHSHVAVILERMQYRGCRSWNMATLACWACWCGRFVSCGRFVKTVVPWLICGGIFVGIVFLILASQ